tara:strand:- start:440202 stop:440828 length:627 start_codon:yes stop_codon:yes gene_type:complete
MGNQKDYLKDISDIKNIMNRSTRFISLSGLSGVLAGVYALIGAYFAHGIIQNIRSTQNQYKRFFVVFDSIEPLVLIAFSVVILAITTGVILTYRKAKNKGEKFWSSSSKRLLFNFLIPLITGGMFCIILIQYEYFSLIAPVTLIFYGLACVNASKYTLGGILYLGLSNIILGLIATQYIGYGLYFWAIGFGVFHILYGTLMYFKYERK